LEESLNISNEAQLVVFVRVPDDVEMLERILFCKSLKYYGTGRAVFYVINNLFGEQKNQMAVV
jgi:hypothetical protein